MIPYAAFFGLASTAALNLELLGAELLLVWYAASGVIG
jgi:hypothetical protein